MGIHDGHRERTKDRFLEYGLDNFSDHNVLELLLFYSCPRIDTNPLAHRLLDHFGSLDKVFDAPVEELMKVKGIGKNTATHIKLMLQVNRRYLISKSDVEHILDSTKKAGAYLLPRYYGERDEVVYMICLDGKCKVISCKLMFRGSVNSANVSIRKIVETALACNATSVIISHNHTSGIAMASREDELTTRRILSALEAVEIKLVDHIIVINGEFISLADSGFFR